MIDIPIICRTAEVVMDEATAHSMWRDSTDDQHLPATISASRDTIDIYEDSSGVPLLVVTKMPSTLRLAYRHAALNYGVDTVTRSRTGTANRAGVFGFLATNALLGRNACCSTMGATKHPKAHAVLAGAAQYLADLLERTCPEQYALNKQMVSCVDDGWLMPGGLWTSGVLNRTSRLPYHRDRNNFEGTWSAMITVRRNVKGGYLHLPELAVNGEPVVLACGDGDVVLFNGQRLMHGVTSMRSTADDGYRFSAVYYAVRRFRVCGDPATSLVRAQDRRAAVEDSLLERQRANGLLTDLDAEK